MKEDEVMRSTRERGVGRTRETGGRLVVQPGLEGLISIV